MEVMTRKIGLIGMRAGCVVLTVAALAYVFSRTSVAELGRTLGSARVGWLVAAMAVYGLVFLAGAWRWHLMLRVTGCVVHWGVSLRMSLIGHLFYTIFFGAAGGDVARSALYARWYQLPLPEILASAPLDRLLGLCGLIIFIALAFGLAAINGAFAEFAPASMRVRPLWIVIATVVVILVWVGAKRLRGGSALARMWRTFKDGGRRLMQSGTVAGQGLACGFIVQLALAASLAFALQAVSHSPLPWGRLAWTFPVISVASALPFNIAGAGLREGAVLTLLGFYGVPAADAVGASLITLAVRLAWAAFGAVIWWREGRWQSPQRPVAGTFSAIIHTVNDGRRLQETITQLQKMPEICEIMIANDDESDDDAMRVAIDGDNCLCGTQAAGSGNSVSSGRMKGEAVIFLPAAASLPPDAGEAIINCLRDARVMGGGVLRTFGGKNRLRAWGRWGAVVRFNLGGGLPNDAIIFLRRDVLEKSGGMQRPFWKRAGWAYRLRKLGRLSLAEVGAHAQSRRTTGRSQIVPAKAVTE